MAFDGIVINKIVCELQNIIDYKIDKILQPDKNTIILGLYGKNTNLALLSSISSNNYRLHLTTHNFKNPSSAPNFCMLLRKHLIGMKIKSISNYDLERIITIELEGFNELNDFVTKKLIIELMGKHGNIILVNENNIIIDSIRHLDTFSNSNRDILPAHEYTLPTSDKISFLNMHSFEEFYNYINIDSSDYINTIANTFTGISKNHLQYLFQKLNLSSNVTKDDLEKVYNTLKNTINTEKLTCKPYEVSSKTDYVIDITDTYSPLSVNFFLDDFYSKKETSEEFKNYRNNILKLILAELKKYTKRLNNINRKLEECDTMDTYKLYGELITANLYKIDNNKNLDEIELENYYDNNNKIVIPLDKTISPAYNAKKYFKKYNKLKNALQIVSEQKKDTAREIDYIESIIYELDSAKTINDVHLIYEEIAENVIFKDTLKDKSVKKSSKNKKKKQEEEFSPLTFVIDGHTVYVGKNNKQNDYLTLKFAHNNDMWFHTKSVHGSHVILKTNGDEISQELINKCASLAAFHSKASTSSNVTVDYTYVRYVKKPANAKPGMVIYTNYETVTVKPNNFE